MFVEQRLLCAIQIPTFAEAGPAFATKRFLNVCAETSLDQLSAAKNVICAKVLHRISRPDGFGASLTGGPPAHLRADGKETGSANEPEE